jgi:hypothetical protein
VVKNSENEGVAETRSSLGRSMLASRFVDCVIDGTRGALNENGIVDRAAAPAVVDPPSRDEGGWFLPLIVLPLRSSLIGGEAGSDFVSTEASPTNVFLLMFRHNYLSCI